MSIIPNPAGAPTIADHNATTPVEKTRRAVSPLRRYLSTRPPSELLEFLETLGCRWVLSSRDNVKSIKLWDDHGLEYTASGKGIAGVVADVVAHYLTWEQRDYQHIQRTTHSTPSGSVPSLPTLPIKKGM